MSKTPRTDAEEFEICVGDIQEIVVDSDFARKLECELTEIKEKLAESNRQNAELEMENATMLKQYFSSETYSLYHVQKELTEQRKINEGLLRIVSSQELNLEKASVHSDKLLADFWDRGEECGILEMQLKEEKDKNNALKVDLARLDDNYKSATQGTRGSMLRGLEDIVKKVIGYKEFSSRPIFVEFVEWAEKLKAKSEERRECMLSVDWLHKDSPQWRKAIEED